jgi:adenylate cyclase
LVLGVNHVTPLVVFAASSLACIVALEILAPADGGLLSEAVMLGGFVAAVASPIALYARLCALPFVRPIGRRRSAESEHQRSEALLTNVLPAAVASRFKASAHQMTTDKYDDASILFADLAGFTAGASDTAPVELVEFLNEVFMAFNRLVERHGLEKIKTTGENYMVVSGVPTARPDHEAPVVRLALEMLDAAGRIHDPHGRPVSIRIGIASGPVVAGVVAGAPIRVRGRSAGPLLASAFVATIADPHAFKSGRCLSA